MRHAHLRIVRELFHQPTRDLLRRPTQLELRPRPPPGAAHTIASFAGFGRRARRNGVLVRTTRPIAAHATIDVHFPRDRRRRPTQPPRDRPSRLTAGQAPRDLLPLASTTTATATAAAPEPAADASPEDCSTPRDATDRSPEPISATRQPLRRQLRDPPLLQLRQPFHHNTPPDRSNPIEGADALTP